VDMSKDRNFRFSPEQDPSEQWRDRFVGNVSTIEADRLRPNQTYYFRVRAVDDEGNVSANSVVANATTWE